MGKLIPVKYGNHLYPSPITPRITEIPGNFDTTRPVSPAGPFSLHTEYCFMPRQFTNPALRGLHRLSNAHKLGVPQLWRDEQWAVEFIQFIVNMCNGNSPEVIEIHPPFDDYSNLESFLKCYSVFEQGVLEHYPNTALFVENRSGTRYKDGSFVLSKADSLVHLSELLDSSGLKLKITLDIPQLFTAHNASRSDIQPLLNDMRGIRHNISGIHLWGKQKNNKGTRVSHCGDLNSYFHNIPNTKALFLNEFCSLLDDEVPRYFVPEVNSAHKDFLSIIQDLLDSGITFI